MIQRYLKILAGLLITSLSASATAHHSFAAVFDSNVIVEVRGTVTDVEWMNPHAWIHVDVQKENDEVEQWSFELGSPNGLVRRGWSRGTIQEGDVISISGYRARDGSLRANVRSVILPSGQTLDGMSSRPKTD